MQLPWRQRSCPPARSDPCSPGTCSAPRISRFDAPAFIRPIPYPLELAQPRGSPRPSPCRADAQSPAPRDPRHSRATHCVPIPTPCRSIARELCVHFNKHFIVRHPSSPAGGRRVLCRLAEIAKGRPPGPAAPPEGPRVTDHELDRKTADRFSTDLPSRHHRAWNPRLPF